MLTVHRHRRVAILLCLVVFANGCGRTQVPPVEEPTPVRIPVRGLWTNPNDFDSPEGSTEILINATTDGPGVWEPRRGFSLLQATGPTISGAIDAMEFFRGYLIVHHNSTSISRWTGSAWSTYSGSFAAPSQARSGRVRLTKAAQSLFVTTSAGVYELDTPTGTWRLTGAPPGLDGTATLRRTVNETGFATANGQWAYRWEWGYKNANGRLEMGAPSGRALVANPANLVVAKANIDKPTGGAKTVRVQNVTHGLTTGEYIDVTLGGAEASYTAGTYQVTVTSSTSFTYVDTGANGVVGNPTNDITYGFSNGRNVSLAIPIPASITTDYFVAVFRSAKSAGATTEPNDQLAQVYERSPTNLEITAGSMTVVDICPDDFRGALMDTSGETLLAAKYQPPSASDMAMFHDCGFYAATIGTRALDLQLIAVGGSSGVVSGDLIVFRNLVAATAAGFWGVVINAATSEALTSGQFQVFTDGTASQNIANTAKSMVRAINALTTNTRLYATYTSGDQEAPGKFQVYARSLTLDSFTAVLDTASASSAYFIPALGRRITSPTTFSRAANVVTWDSTTPHGFSVGQTIELELISGASEPNFPTGTKTVASTPSATQFTYAETGANATAASAYAVFGTPLADVTANQINRSDRVVYSLPDQPWAVPLPNELFCDGVPTDPSSTCPAIDRLIPTRDRLYVMTDAGLFQITGFYPDFAITTIQTPLKSQIPESWVSTGTPGAVYGMTDVGAVAVQNTAEKISIPIQDQIQAISTTLAAAGHSSYLPLYGFSVAYPQDSKVLTFLPTSGSNTWGDTAFVWHTLTGDWAKWDFSAQKPTAGVLDPTTEKLYLGTSTGAVLVERKARSLADYYDVRPASIAYAASGAFGGTTITGTTTAGMTVGEKVTDLSSGTETTITSIDSASQITVASVAGFSGGGGNLYVSGGAIPSTIQWTRWYGKGPEKDKEVDSGLILVQPPSLSAPGTPEFTTISMAVSNDYNPTFSTPETLTLSSVVTSQMPFLVPADMQRGGWYRFKIAHANPGERYKLLGLSLNARESGAKGGP